MRRSCFSTRQPQRSTPESETLVRTAPERLTQGRTTIVIAHRLATIIKADRILVMENGRIAEEGTHKSLVAKGGVYARLAKLQFDTGLQTASNADFFNAIRQR